MRQKVGSMNSNIDGATGSGTMLSLGIIVVAMAGFGLTQTVAANYLSQARLDSITESAALSADDALRGLVTGYPCEIAREIAIENIVILDECRIVGFEAFVQMRVQGIGIVLNARARAGPSS